MGGITNTDWGDFNTHVFIFTDAYFEEFTILRFSIYSSDRFKIRWKKWIDLMENY